MATFTDADRKFQQEMRRTHDDIGSLIADLSSIGLIQTQKYAAVKEKVRKVREEMKSVSALWRDVQTEYLKLNK